MKIQNLEQVDSLTYINNQYLKRIQEWESEVENLKESVDSLQKVKNQIIVKKDAVIVSESTSAAVEQLKQNLSK